MKKNVLIVILALIVVGGGGFVAGDKLSEKNTAPEATVESTTDESVTVEAVKEAVVPEATEKVNSEIATPVTEKVIVTEKVVEVLQKYEEPKPEDVKPAEKVTEAVKPVEKVTEAVKPVEKVTVAVKPIEKVTVAVTKVNEPEKPVETTTNSAEKISREKAKSIALNHAGLKEADVRELEIELDKEKGVLLYEVNFESGKYDYEYDIDAITGAIKFSEKEPEVEAKVNKHEIKVETTTNSAEKISREKAKSIALNHAGLKEADVRELEIELDKEKGALLYEVNFESGKYDYEYDIDAITGAIKFSKKGFDD